MKHLIAQLQKYWRGPAVQIKLGQQGYLLGQGQPKTTMIVRSKKVVRQLLTSPSLGFGEAYMRGDITIDGDLMDILKGFHLSSGDQTRLVRKYRRLLERSKISPSKATKNAQHHYDTGNDFYALWLGSSMTYSCAYFLNSSDTLDQAQKQKNELICRKIRLKQGMTVLDIGAGWGGTLFHAAENYGAQVTGVTPAKEQAQYIMAEAKRRGIENQVQILNTDWRKVTGRYDRVISVGMFEHVGPSHYQDFLQRWADCLTDDGISLLHTIGIKNATTSGADPWAIKYIFPGGVLPTMDQIVEPAGQANLIVADIEDLWQHYALTLSHWSQNFLKVRNQVVDMFDEEFARMWWLYLQGVEAGFRWGNMQLWQLVLLKDKHSRWPLNREVETKNLGYPKLEKTGQI